MPGRSGGGENPFSFARTTKTQECFSLKVGVGRNWFSWCHKAPIIFVLLLFPYRHTHTSQTQTSQFRKILEKKVIRVVRKRRTSQPVHTFTILPRKAVLIPHHAEAEAVPVHIYRGKKPNHVNNRVLDHSPLLYNIQMISKLSLKELFLSCRGGEENTAQRIIRS